MSIEDEIVQEGQVFQRQCATLIERIADTVFESIVYGSYVTNAPGQPVRDGDLVKSWKQQPLSDKSILISSDSPYAKKVEYGHQKTTNHGSFSMTKTIAGFGKLVDLEVEKMRSAL
jgi:hypothetical protein